MLPIHEYLQQLRTVRLRNTGTIVATSLGATWLVFSIATLSIFMVHSIKSCIATMLALLALIGEIVVALSAAITSGATISVIVILATGVASFSFPASSIRARVCMSAYVSASSVFMAYFSLLWFSSLQINMDIAATIVAAAAISVAVASAWATGILSLVERETQQAGIRMTSVLDAVRNNHYVILKILLKLHFGVRQSDLDVALIHAVKAGFVESTTILLEAGASANARDSYENTPLLIASDHGLIDLMLMLLEKGAKVNVVNTEHATPLHNAAKWGHTECVRLLIDRGAKLNQTDGLWRTPLMLAAKHATEPEQVMRLLITSGARVNLIGCEHRTVLHYSASRGIAISWLIGLGARCDIPDVEGNTPLHNAALEGQLDAVKTLLVNGNSNVNHINNHMRSPLHFAVMKGTAECVELLLSNGANFRLVDSFKNLPIYYASSQGNFNAVLALVSANSPLGSFTTNGCVIPASNPMKSAVRYRRFDVMKLLLVAGCDIKPLQDWLVEWSIESHGLYQEHVDWFTSVMYQPSRLLDISRLVIRQNVRDPFLSNIKSLPIPHIMGEFLLMRELTLK